MKRKVPKSLQAIIITLLVGMFLPKLISLTGVTLVDKVIWKIVLTLAFNLATIIVGVLFPTKLIHGKVEGGKARIIIYFVIIVVFLCSASSIIVFFTEVAKWVLIVLGAIALGLILAIIFYYVFSVKKSKRRFKVSQTKSIENIADRKPVVAQTKRLAQSIPSQVTPATKEVSTAPQNDVSDSDEIDVREVEQTQEPLKTIYELWAEKDPREKCLTITNDENPDLRWVKIYKPPYGNGKFYGYVMMMNARNTVNGEIYFADEQIWHLYKG